MARSCVAKREVVFHFASNPAQSSRLQFESHEDLLWHVVFRIDTKFAGW